MLGLERKLAQAGRKAASITASAVLILIGAAFLTVAAWIFLSVAQSALFAATVIGTFYVGLGLVILGLGVSRPPRRLQEEKPLGGLSPLQLVTISFLQGLDQGRSAKRHL